jgi:hypothetical protein
MKNNETQKQCKYNKFVVLTTRTITIIKITTNNDNDNNNNNKSHHFSYLCFDLLTQQLTFTKPNRLQRKTGKYKKIKIKREM